MSELDFRPTANLKFKNYCETDMYVSIKIYNRQEHLKIHETVEVPKATIRLVDVDEKTKVKEVIPSEKIFSAKVFRAGVIKMKYHPPTLETNFTLDPLEIPDSNNDANHNIAISGLDLYDPKESKSNLFKLGTNLNIKADSIFKRLVDIESQLGSLIVRKEQSGKLVTIDIISLKKVDMVYAAPSTLKETTSTEKSIIADLKLSVPIYGSIEAGMSNSDLYQLKCEIDYYHYENTIGFASLVTELDMEAKKKLIEKLKLNDPNLVLYTLRNFDVIEKGLFSVTKGTKLTTEASAAIASVFTANAAYAFQSKDSELISIPNKVYNEVYEPWQTVGELLGKLEQM